VKNFFEISILCLFLLASCAGDKSLLNEKIYDGPVISVENVYSRHSDDGIVKIIIKADKQEQYDNGDEKWPEGMLLELYDVKSSELTTTFTADKVTHVKENGIYRGEGNVIVENLKSKEVLTTEELFWNPNKKIFFTERFVTIVDDEGLPTYGQGLTANQDFTEYTITEPDGETIIDKDIN